ncbi:sequestering of TGFbeta in extracellular matrix [Mactra antiquata]
MLRWMLFVVFQVVICSAQNNTICGNITCSNASRGCTKDGNSCDCFYGYVGPACNEDRDECSLAHHPLCGTTGMCVNTVGRFKCVCLQGWYGAHCRSRNTSLPADCLPGWTGEDCKTDIDECNTYHNGTKQGLCEPHAICLNTAGSYTCDCLSGWSGDNCTTDINECDTLQPCQNNGTCTNTPGSFDCVCTHGWAGDNCATDINECDALQPCQNNGTCTNTPGSFDCVCTRGWSGDNCTTDVNECVSTPCNVQENCSNTIGSYKCIRLDLNRSTLSIDSSIQVTMVTSNMATSFISMREDTTASEKTKTNLIVGVTVGCFLVIVCIIAGVILVRYLSRKSRKITDQDTMRELRVEINEDASVNIDTATVNTTPPKQQQQQQHEEIVIKTRLSINKTSS